MGSLSRATRWLVAGLLLFAGTGPVRVASAEDEASAPDLAALLADAVDRPTADGRKQAALVLAHRQDVTVDRWIDAMRAFGTFAAAPAGVWAYDVALPSDTPRLRTAHTTVYVPAGYDPKQPAPLLLALHGAGGRGEDMVPLWRATADALGMLVVAPTEAGENAGYGFTERERDDALAVLRWARRRYDVDENRIHLTGVSRGGHLAWDLALRHPTGWASLAVMIGGPRLAVAGGQNNLRYAENVAHLPIRDLQGKGDDPRLLADVALVFERLQAAKAADANLLLQEGYAHGFDPNAVDWAAFFEGAHRDPHRATVVRRAARSGEGRQAWAEILRTEGDVQETFPLRVRAVRWNRLDEDERRRTMQDQADEHTARMEVRREADGRYVARTTGVAAFRILLTREDLPEKGRIEVRADRRRVRRDAAEDQSVLLVDFAEHFDRTFLPVMEVRVP